MNGVVLPAWLDTLLAIVEQAQFGLLQLWHWLGLTGDVHGQPAWPWSHRIAGETLLIDLGVARQLAWTGIAVALSLMAMLLALPWRRRRAMLLAIAAAGLLLAPWPAPVLLFVPAAPTSFHASPTGFSVEAIALGARIYGQHCAACHGDDGRGEGPLAATLPRWPPTLVGPLLGRRADGELFWRIADGMREDHGGPVMPAFAGVLSDGEIWAVLDYAKALAAGEGAKSAGSWPMAVALPDMAIRCGAGTPRRLAQWRDGQRLRLVAFDGSSDRIPLEDPRFLTLLVTPDGKPPAFVPQFRSDCAAVSPQAWDTVARLAGVAPERLGGTELLADRDGWLRARGTPQQKGWSDADLLCESGQGAKPTTSATTEKPAPDGLTAVLLRMDAEPVRFVKGGIVH
ncbi:cytochrome c [Cupriavidus sp. UGS-1]|uniref:c-type cytochrome n=1 Tax=Cupriavidus sp. UGS-1 TaxID=2899826 RepID=UPI001E2BF2E5|nr:cytochrome c [Cupriavidus sp. UGS-1]MCD9122493.1 cytochrome c [Cupriavidus sp. UGS-1]